MKITLSDLREQYGSVYLTELPDGQLVPWVPLSFNDFLKYQNDFNRGLISHVIIEEEIFKKCVKDSFIIQNINRQKAGTVSTVVTKIFEQSGPTQLETFNHQLNISRQLLELNIFHNIVPLICAAFPAYKPEDIYKLEYQDLMIRLAQAESHLLKIGYLQEPIQLYPKEKEQSQQYSAPPTDLKQAWEQQQIEQQKVTSNPQKKVNLSNIRLQEDITPAPKHKTEKGNVIISKEDMATRYAVGNDIEDLPFMERQMLEEASTIYKDYLDDVKEGKKVIIKSPEERLKEKKDKTRQSKLKRSR